MELDENIQTALKDLLYGRASMYEFLALIFKEPVKENFKGLSAKFLPVLKNIVQEDDENLKKGITLLEEYIAYENEKDESELCHIFNKTYTSLFYLGMNSVLSDFHSMVLDGQASIPFTKLQEERRE